MVKEICVRLARANDPEVVQALAEELSLSLKQFLSSMDGNLPAAS